MGGHAVDGQPPRGKPQGVRPGAACSPRARRQAKKTTNHGPFGSAFFETGVYPGRLLEGRGFFAAVAAVIVGDKRDLMPDSAPSFVMGPHPNDFHRPFLRVDLIHKSVLDVNPPGPCTIEISDQLLKSWRALKRILLQNLKQAFCLGPKIAGRQLLGVLQGLLGVIELPGHQAISVLALPNGSLNPFRMDSRIPGIDRR